MINHIAVAVEGIGFNHGLVDTMGFGFFEITIETRPITGGSPWFPVEDYYIVVKIKTKSGKIYQDQYLASSHGIRHIIKIIALFKGINKNIKEISIKLHKIGLKINKILINTKLINR